MEWAGWARRFFVIAWVAWAAGCYAVLEVITSDFLRSCFIYAYVFALLSWLSIIVEAGMV